MARIVKGGKEPIITKLACRRQIYHRCFVRKFLSDLTMPLILAAVAVATVMLVKRDQAPVAGEELSLPEWDQSHSESQFKSCRILSSPQPNFFLPEGIPAADGERTCHADFANAGEGKIRIYLINRTSSPTAVGTTHGSPEIKAYRELPDGTWEVVQPRITFVMCGDSIRSVTIPPGMFVAIEAKFHPPSGNPGTIRYQSRSGWISNSGAGFWDPEERDIANSHQQIQPLFLFAGEWFHFVNFDEGLDSRLRMGKLLGRIELQASYASSRGSELLCQSLLKSSDKFPAAWREAAIERLQALKRMDHQGDKSGFASRCLNYLERDSSLAPFGSPSLYPDLCWQALAAFSHIPEHSRDAPWERVFTVMRSRFPNAEDVELKGMSRLLENELVVHETLESELLRAGLKSRQREFQSRCVKLLLQRSEEAEIIRIAESLDEERRFAITNVLATNDAIARRHGAINEFLLRRAKENPKRTLEAIYIGCGRKTDVHIEPGLWLELRPYMEKTLMQGVDEERNIRDSGQRETMLRILQMGYRNRPPVLRKLAQSKAYYEERSFITSEGEKVRKVYFMSQAARKALANMGLVP